MNGNGQVVQLSKDNHRSKRDGVAKGRGGLKNFEIALWQSLSDIFHIFLMGSHGLFFVVLNSY